MSQTFCANENCPKHTEYRGGRFRFIGGKWLCQECWEWAGGLANAGKNLWDFTTTHFNGQPIHVKSGAHLDQLCKQFGVSNCARENYERNW
jgi:hypothetical protein